MTRGASSFMSSRRGAVALSFIAVPKRASARAISRAADIFRSPGAPAAVRSGAVLASLGFGGLPLRLKGGGSVVQQVQQASRARRIGSRLDQFLNQSKVTMYCPH